MEPLIYVYKDEDGRKFVKSIRNASIMALYFIGSTKTSTIPGVSVAGASPELTLYTPAVDAEYLVYGKPISMRNVPVTPEGIPTPALITRAALKIAKIPFLIVDTGSFIKPKIPHITLPSNVVGNRIDTGKALPYTTAKNLYEEARILARKISHVADVFVLGESIPGGTTTALGILIALGYNAWGMVSSAGPRNPHDLKQRIVKSGLDKSKELPTNDPFRAVSCLGDPVHVSMAGFLAGVLEKGSKVILAGGTQMAAVLAIAKHNGLELSNELIIGTTRWIIDDKSSNIVKLVKMVSPEVPIIAYNYDFSNSPYQGLRYYEQGFVKEGVGAGGTSIAATIVRGVPYIKLWEAIHQEYKKLIEEGYNAIKEK
ncbi:MAG: nicotinate mononucleotide-dependent phosphoribosyltransferase CobT [Pyrodictiaceae archaeon]